MTSVTGQIHQPKKDPPCFRMPRVSPVSLPIRPWPFRIFCVVPRTSSVNRASKYYSLLKIPWSHKERAPSNSSSSFHCSKRRKKSPVTMGANEANRPGAIIPREPLRYDIHTRSVFRFLMCANTEVPELSALTNNSLCRATHCSLPSKQTKHSSSTKTSSNNSGCATSIESNDV